MTSFSMRRYAPQRARPQHRLLGGLADDDVELLRQAATATAGEWTHQEAARLLLDAPTLAGIGGV